MYDALYNSIAHMKSMTHTMKALSRSLRVTCKLPTSLMLTQARAMRWFSHCWWDHALWYANRCTGSVLDAGALMLVLPSWE